MKSIKSVLLTAATATLIAPSISFASPNVWNGDQYDLSEPRAFELKMNVNLSAPTASLKLALGPVGFYCNSALTPEMCLSAVVEAAASLDSSVPCKASDVSEISITTEHRKHFSSQKDVNRVIYLDFDMSKPLAQRLKSLREQAVDLCSGKTFSTK